MSIRGLPIGRLVAESVVVVGSILLALAIDQAMAERQDRALEAQYLGALTEDFRRTVFWTAEAGPQVNGDREQNALLIDAVLKSQPAGEFDSVAVAHSLVRLTAVPHLRVYEATMNELLATGNVRVIRDPKLRSLMVEFFDLAETFRELQAPMMDRVSEAKIQLSPHVEPAIMRAIAADGWARGTGERARVRPTAAEVAVSDATPLWMPLDSSTARPELRAAIASSSFMDGLRADSSIPGVISMMLEDIYLIRFQLQDLTYQAQEILLILEAEVDRGTT